MKSLFVLILSVLFAMSCTTNSDSPNPESENIGSEVAKESSRYICHATLENVLNTYNYSHNCLAGYTTQRITFFGEIYLDEVSGGNCSGCTICCLDMGAGNNSYDVWLEAVDIALDNTPAHHCLIDLDFVVLISGPSCIGQSEVRFIAEYRDETEEEEGPGL